MAQFKRIKETRGNFTIVEVVGDVLHGEIIDFLENLQVEDPSTRAIFDFRAANLSALLTNRIRSDVHKIRKFAGPGIRAALVFSNPADFSIGKAIGHAISGAGYLADIRGFYNLYLAKDWLLFGNGVSDPQ